MSDSTPTGQAILDRRLAAARGEFEAFRDFVADAPPDALVAGAIGSLSLFASFLGFLLVSPLTVVAMIVFLMATGYGWIRHQALTARAVTLAMTASTITILGLITVFVFLRA
ncbi:MAG: phosphate transport system permease protein, partial [Halobacteriales archaeon]